MYTIILTNGKTIDINADEVEWYTKERLIKFINNCHVIARINMDSVVGVIESDCMVESENNKE